MADPRFPSAKEVELFHTNSDKDGSPTSLHHTLGNGPNQAAPGDHTHDGGTSKELGDSITYSWTPLPYSGGWVDFGGSFQVGQYRKVGDDVEIRGMMKHATTTTTGTFATLPVGFRPPATVQFWGCGSGGGNVDIRITSGGVMTVTAYGAGASGASISLAPIRFSVTT